MFDFAFCSRQVIDVEKYEVIYVSPRNYFVFTPMLAAASVGTVDVRSITEPIRMANPCVKYVTGEAIDIKIEEKKVSRCFNMCLSRMWKSVHLWNAWYISFAPINSPEFNKIQ